jgi:hypothetical protein
MNSNFIGRNRALFHCSGQDSYEMGIPAYINSQDQSRIHLLNGMGRKPDTYSLDGSYLDLSINDLDNFRDEHTNFDREELYDIDELFMLEKMMYEQQLQRIALINQLKQELYSEDDCTFLEKLRLKQQRLSKSLNNYDGTLDSSTMNQAKKQSFYNIQPQKKGCFYNIQPQKKGYEKDRCGQRFSIKQLSEPAFSIKSQSLSDSSKACQQQEPLSKSRHCRHFLKGHCERGDSCGFRHDQSLFCTDLQKVFLGGLPAYLTSSLLRKKLTEQGYTVLNNPKILRWFSPQVCLGSVEEAQRLIKKQVIVIDKTVVRVRPFEAFAQDSEKKLPDEVERSVFLGGLKKGTTARIIRDDLRKMGLVVVNIPVLKSGYSPQVVLQTFHQAQTLIKLMRVRINGTIVNVRPYANIRSSSKKK